MNEFRVKFKSNKNITYTCKYHVIWCPKYRRKVLVNGVDNRLKNIIKTVCEENRSELFEMEVMDDHVHVLLEVDPQFGVHQLIKKIKGRSSRILRNEFPWLRSRLPCLWTNSYFIATVGGAPIQIVKQYIERQKHV